MDDIEREVMSFYISSLEDMDCVTSIEVSDNKETTFHVVGKAKVLIIDERW